MGTTTEEIGGQLTQAKALGARPASRDRVIQAVVEEEDTLFGGQCPGHMTAQMGQAAAVRDDAVAGKDRLRTLRTLGLALFHCCPSGTQEEDDLSQVSSAENQPHGDLVEAASMVSAISTSTLSRFFEFGSKPASAVRISTSAHSQS